ncbi:MAG: helix-turn-helix transcriptional regulator [Prevotella sp.]|nr:helix-turn-helix transcriptional regulator [Prevotella sp.]
MDIVGENPIQLILFFTLYGITGVVPLIAALYLLLRRANAIAPGVTPPVRLRCWTASFFVVSSLAHVWWLLFYIYSGDLQSVSYLLLVMLDFVTLFTTFAGMLLAMLQDRRRSVRPALTAMIPFMALWGAFMVYPNDLIELIAGVYLLLLGLVFTIYMVLAIRQYSRWLNDNYADLENKKVWLCQAVALVCMLLFVLYVLATNMVLIWLVHIIELVFVVLLLWRVETLPQLDSPMEGESNVLAQDTSNLIPADAPASSHSSTPQPAAPVTIDLAQIERLLNEHCVAPQLYLKHDLSLQELAQAVGTNRYYLSQYFSRQGITYNTFINNLRINNFISRYEEAVAAGQSVVAQELAYESGFGSYRTFSRAFTQRMGQNVTDWIGEREG